MEKESRPSGSDKGAQGGVGPNVGQARKTRAGAKGWLTRSLNSLHFKIDGDEGKHVIEVGLTELERRAEALEEAQSLYESLITEEEFQEAMEEVAPLFDEVQILKARAYKYLADMMKPIGDDVSVASEGSFSSRAGRPAVKLPKLELTHFKGDVTTWTSWWDNYEATIHKSDLPDVTKFTYLRSLLDSEAAAVIKGLRLTSDNYEIACNLLKERFGRKELIIFSHIQNLMSLESQSNIKSRIKRLSTLQDEITINVRSLETLGIDGSTYGVFLTPLVLSRLPTDVRMEWAREGKGKEGNLDFLLDFLKEEIQTRERADTFRIPENRNDGQPEVKDVKPTAAALLAQSTHQQCGVCKKGHATVKCRSLRGMDQARREQTVKDARLCFKCLEVGHACRNCPSSIKCFECGGPHFKIMCRKVGATQRDGVGERTGYNDSKTETLVDNQVTIAHAPHPRTNTDVFLQVVTVEAGGPTRKESVNVLFDSGADRTYITQSLADKLRLPCLGKVQHRYAVFGGEKSKIYSRNIYKFELSCIDNMPLYVTGIEVPTICAPIVRPQVPREVLHGLKGLPFRSVDRESVEVDVLIGLDHYWEIVKDKVIRFPGQDIVAQETRLGYILSGQARGGSNSVLTSHQLLCLNDISETELRRFWDLESIGISEKQEKDVDPIMASFEKSVEFRDGRYVVGLPWKEGMKERLSSNKVAAEHRLASLGRKLSKDPPLLERYNNALQEMEDNKVIEEVESGQEHRGPLFYLPHRPVVREGSLTTKVRPVFDASAQDHNGISLNDCIETGPILTPNLVEVLIRFRRWPVALTADISKAFLQIGLKEEDRDVHRFLWDVGGRKRVMKFSRVTFGVKSSPFLLNATVKHHLKQFEPSTVVSELTKNLYVDDWLSGANSIVEAKQMYCEAQEIMKSAGMELAKWHSNCKEIKQGVAESYEGQVSILGSRWTLDKDFFSFDGVEMPQNIFVTKRLVLSVIARIFDPLGLLLPFTMLAKCLFQKLWLLGISWDEEIPKELLLQFTKWIEDSKVVRSWSIPRKFSSRVWDTFENIELHAFGDASSVGYGASVYIRILVSENRYASSLVVARARVAPLKKVTLPRLELLASLLAARLLCFVRQSLELPSEIKYRCWTDSMVALGWIRGDPARWKQFVANRVSEIVSLTEPGKWAYCPTEDNPADLLTRGVSAAVLVESEKWLHGPEWLVKSEEFWPQVSGCQAAPDVLVSSEVLVATQVKFEAVFEVNRWSKLSKAIRVVAWILRFICNARNRAEKRSGELSYLEQSRAKISLFKDSQRRAFPEEIELLRQGNEVSKGSSIFKLSPYLDEEGLMRVKGRLERSELSYEEKHPIILPKDHLSKLLVRFQHALSKHAGVATLVTCLRNSYWIIRLRQLCKTVVFECMSCQRLLAKSCNQVGAPLPGDRVCRAPPFSVTGVDFAGPVYCKDLPSQKFYIPLFTCGVIRAVHLELTSGLTAKEFVLAFRRFCARRGTPRTVYSDNAKTFVGSQTLLQDLLGIGAPEWKFIAPRSPWWGGWWERLVRTMKDAIKRSIGKQCLTKSELETLLTEVEYCVNSRPLTFVGDDVSLDRPISPNLFLLGEERSVEGSTLPETPKTVGDLVCLRERNAHDIELFWTKWSNDYLRNLPSIVPQFVARGSLKKNSVVLVREDNIARLNWVLGKVIDLFPGRDGKVRSVRLQTAKGEIVRAIQRLHKLEFLDPVPQDVDKKESVGESSQEVKIDSPNSDPSISPSMPHSQISRSRSGRLIKPVKRLDM